MDARTPFSILIVDAHPLVGKWLKQVITGEYRGVVFGEASSADAALARIAGRPWNLIVIDISVPCRNGFYVLRESLRQQPSTRILVLTTHADTSCAARALQMGASGYLSGDAGNLDLLKALKTIRAGKRYFERSILENPAVRMEPAHLSLSAREFDVLLALAAGKSERHIAAGLALSIKTVSTYKRRILNKLHVQATADIVDYVILHGLSSASLGCPRATQAVESLLTPFSGLSES